MGLIADSFTAACQRADSSIVKSGWMTPEPPRDAIAAANSETPYFFFFFQYVITNEGTPALTATSSASKTSSALVPLSSAVTAAA